MSLPSPAVNASRFRPDEQAWDACRQGRDLILSGHGQAGIQRMRQAAALAPDNPYVQVNPLTHSHYLPETTRLDCLDGYVRWAERFYPPALARQGHPNVRDPERRLRIAYISADFYKHSVAYTFEPLLDGLDRDAMEVYGYGNVTTPDEVTDRLSRKFDVYRSIYGCDLEAILEQIRADRIDILVALAGHTTGNCLEILAYKPAPVQVDMGGLCTTGMRQVDYRITDELYDPVESQAYYVERCVCLPGGLSVFRPPRVSPLVAPLPALTQGRMTFGAFNHCAKISPMILDRWAAILTRLPDARIILKFPKGETPALQSQFLEAFADRGISRERVRVQGYLPYSDYLDLLNQVDLLLDTYPYNGGITTLEGLWMGVPTLSLTGETFASRAGLSILSRVGLDCFCCSDIHEYEEKALAFSAQPCELNQIRQGLRAKVLTSSLCDAGRMSHELMHAYRWMWQQYCREDQAQ